MKKLNTLAGVVLLGSCLMSAQDQPATATQPDGRTQTARTSQAEDRGTNWGWIGLLGLAGLAGLRGRREISRDVVSERDTRRVA
jgi:MYXO-CTERM domain-containing protein